MIAASMAFAQSTFTIRRPGDGSIVREVVAVRIPRRSIPSTGYVGIMINGKFLEAVAPVGKEDIQGDDFVYKLDTKAREIPDGNLKIEAVLYADFGDASRVLNRSSVRLVLDNRNSLKAPDGGFKLRYNFASGRSFDYSLTMRQSFVLMSEAQAKMGAKPPELPQGSFNARYRYTFENSYAADGGRREGLVRMEILPDKGKDYAILPLSTDPTPKKRYKSEFYPIYMRISDTGREIFGRAPYYVPMEGSSSQNAAVYIFGNFPLPVLPTVGVRPGDAWSGSIVQSAMTMDQIFGQKTISAPQPARGQLVTIEWERGRRCAKITNRIATGKAAADGNQQEIEETYWFSMDDGMIIRLERNYITTTKVQISNGGGSAAGGGSGRGGRAGRPGAASTSGGGGVGGPTGSEYTGPETGNFQRPPGAPGGDGGEEGRDGGARGQGGRGQGRPGQGTTAGGGTRGNQGSGSSVRLLKTRTQMILVLD